jgi:predicted RND superfamily exporter protein
MEDARSLRSHLESLHAPTAIIHGGMFVYANRAYLKRFGVSDLDELFGIPLLDMVDARHHDRLRHHLEAAETVKPGAKETPRARLAMSTMGGDPFRVVMSSHGVVYEGEQCAQISIRTREDTTLWGFFKNLPWALYGSVALLLLLITLPSLLLLKLDINNAPKVYFPPDEPAVTVDDAVREKFPNDQVVVMLFDGVALFSDGFLQAYDQLAERLNEHPQVDEVLALTTVDHISGSADGFIVEPLIDTGKLMESHPSERPAMVLADRFARRYLVSEDGSALAMVVIPKGADTSLLRKSLLEDIQLEVEEARLEGYLTATAGNVPVDVAELHSMLRDNMIFIPVTSTIGLLLIWLLFHRPLAVVIGGIAIGVVVSSTIALYVLIGRPFTLISSIIPPLLSALTIAALVHLFNALHYAAQRGLVGKFRVEKALQEIRQPARFTALTTAAGMASLGASPIAPIATFGLTSALGVVLIYVVVILLVPPLFARWDHAAWPKRKGGGGWMDVGLRFLSHVGIRHPGAVIGVTVVLLIVGVPQLFNIKVETNLQEFFDPTHEVRRSTDQIDERLIGTMPLQVVFTASAPEGIKLPENLQEIRRFQDWVEQLPEVDKSISPADFIEDMNWGFNEEKPQFRKIPNNPKLVSQYLFIYDGDDMYDVVDRDYNVGLVNLNLNVHSASEISRVMEQIKEYLAQNAGTGMTWDIAGMGRLFSDMEELLVRGQVYSLSGALFLIFILMLVLWRSLNQALLCMIPNLSPILLIFIFMGIFGIWLDMATAMIASVAAGIAVDDTIHVFHGFIKRIKAGSSPVSALVRTYHQAGRAVLTTTIILSAQFMVLVASEFIPTGNFGMLTSIGLVAALLFDLMLLPAILLLIYDPRSRKRPAKAVRSRENS